MKVTLNFNKSIIQHTKKNVLPKIFKKTVKSYSLPIISTPIILYNLKATRDTNNSINCRKAIEKQKERLENGEITQQEYNQNVAKIEKYYENADKLPENISSQKIKQGEPSFKATEDNIITKDSIQNDKVEVSELTAEELAEIDNIDESLPPDLAEFLATPVDPAGEGLIDNIMDLDDSELGADDNFFSMIKNFLADSADWF